MPVVKCPAEQSDGKLCVRLESSGYTVGCMLALQSQQLIHRISGGKVRCYQKCAYVGGGALGNRAWP